jgi:nondiscriminating glutamyl-tRNA synthetase
MALFLFVPDAETLTAESARRAFFLWLCARQQHELFLLPPQQTGAPELWREELCWLGLEGNADGDPGEMPEWLRRLPALEECEPSPWGQWSGRTRVAELRELGVLPEALLNFLALTAWAPLPDPETEKTREILSREDILALWSPENMLRDPVRFDFEQLRRINHAWLERADLDRLVILALPYYQRVDWLPREVSEPVRLWLRDLIRAVLPGLDFLSLLPPRTRLVFDYQPENYLRVPESRQAMEREGAREVLRAFGQQALEDSWLTPERFHRIMEDLKRETPWRGRALYHPIRVLLTGLPFGPSLDDLLPLIERGAELDLPVRIKSCRERVLEFCAVFV